MTKMSLCIHIVLSEPLLITHINKGSKFRPEIRPVTPLAAHTVKPV